MSTFLYTLGHRIARNRWKVLVTWVLLAAAAFAISGVAGGQLVNDYSIPGTESQRGIDTLAQRFPQASGTTGQIVFTSTSGPIADQQAAIEAQIQAIDKVQHVTSVDDPFASDAVGTISPDKLNALSSIQFDVASTDLPPEAITEVEAAATPPAGAKFTVTLGGAMYPQPTLGIGITEVLGVLLAFAVLAITFASLLAAGLPLLTAALGVAITLAGVLTVASFATISSTTPTLALMIGLAVGIDYGLFIVTRHRRQLAAGISVHESVAQASATAGSAVVFAGTTVIIALCGLAVAQIPFLSVMGYAAASGVSISSPVGLVGFAILAAAAFAATNQALVGVFGGVGRMVSIALVAIQVAAFGGLVPIETAPAALQTLNGILPLPQFVAGAGRLLLGGGGDVVGPCLTLVGWTVGAFLVSVLCAARQRPDLALAARPQTAPAPMSVMAEQT